MVGGVDEAWTLMRRPTRLRPEADRPTLGRRLRLDLRWSSRRQSSLPPSPSPRSSRCVFEAHQRQTGGHDLDGVC